MSEPRLEFPARQEEAHMMARVDRAAVVLLVVLGVAAGCSRDKSVGPEPTRGKITAKASGIQGQSGNLDIA